MTQNTFVTFSSTALPVRSYWLERPRVFCWNTFPVLLLYTYLSKDNVWLFLDDKIPRAWHLLWQESVQLQGWMLDKIMGVAIESTANPSLPKGWIFPEPLHPWAPQFHLQSAKFVFAFHIIFSILSGTPGSLLQYSNPLHMQTTEWCLGFWVWRKCTVKLQSLLLCKPWGEGFQVLMAGAPFLHRAPLFLSVKT